MATTRTEKAENGNDIFKLEFDNGDFLCDDNGEFIQVQSAIVPGDTIWTNERP